MLLPALVSAMALAVAMVSPVPTMRPEANLIATEETQAVCPVCGMAIAPGKGSKVIVQGHEYTVDSKACGDKLAANPEMYLNADGTPKNAKKNKQY